MFPILQFVPNAESVLKADGVCLQLFAQSGLEISEFADMEELSNHMGLFLQVSLPVYASQAFQLFCSALLFLAKNLPFIVTGVQRLLRCNALKRATVIQLDSGCLCHHTLAAMSLQLAPTC